MQSLSVIFQLAGAVALLLFGLGLVLLAPRLMLRETTAPPP